MHRSFILSCLLLLVTSGPRSHTVDDLWWMAWQENVTQIIMLTSIKEGGKVCSLPEVVILFICISSLSLDVWWLYFNYSWINWNVHWKHVSSFSRTSNSPQNVIPFSLSFFFILIIKHVGQVWRVLAISRHNDDIWSRDCNSPEDGQQSRFRCSVFCAGVKTGRNSFWRKFYF